VQILFLTRNHSVEVINGGDLFDHLEDLCETCAAGVFFAWEGAKICI
jgi:hypothetical protein